MSNDTLTIIEFVKSIKAKGEIEIINDYTFTWNLDGLFLHFLIDDEETTISYSRHKSHHQIGHFHQDNYDVINLIQDINNENKRVHITNFLGSCFCIEDKTQKKKKSWLLIHHYYSEL